MPMSGGGSGIQGAVRRNVDLPELESFAGSTKRRAFLPLSFRPFLVKVGCLDRLEMGWLVANARGTVATREQRVSRWYWSSVVLRKYLQG